jgi:hypothetical protein
VRDRRRPPEFEAQSLRVEDEVERGPTLSGRGAAAAAWATHKLIDAPAAGETVVQNLRAKLQAISKGSVKNFLDALVPLHVEWHSSGTFMGQPIGLLSFHHELIVAYREVHQANRSQPQAALDLARLDPDSKPFPTAALDGASSPKAFEEEISNWHADQHYVQAARMSPDHMVHAHGGGMMDASKNIYLDQFWQLHVLLDELAHHGMSYEQIDHTEV